MTPSSPPARGVALLGWSFSGPMTVLIATCICGFGSTPSKTSRPYRSKSALISARVSASAHASRVTPPTRAPKSMSGRMGSTRQRGHGVLLSGARRFTAHRRSCGPPTRRAGGRAGASARRATPSRSISARRSFHSSSPHGGSTSVAPGRPGRERLRRGPRVRHVRRPAAEHEDRHAEPGDVGGVEAGHERVVARAVRHRPAVHHREELLAVHREEAVTVARVLGDRLLPLVELDHGLHAAVPRGVGRGHAVVVRELEQAGHAAADPPHREAGGDVGIAGRGEQRDARAARAAGDHGRARGRGGAAARRARRPAPPTPTGRRTRPTTPRSSGGPT